MKTFTIADYAVLIAVLIVITAIGLYYRYTGGRQSSSEEYLLGDRDQSVLPVALSLAASHMSGIMMLGTPAEVYYRGAIFSVKTLAIAFIVPVTAHLLLPVFYKVGSSSSNEYLKLRFGRTVQTLASVTYPLQSVLFMAVVLYAPSLALETLSGLPTLWSIIIVGSVCTFYSTIGGIKAVIMTDVFQFFLSFLAVFSIILSEYMDKGSFTNILKIASEGGRLNFAHFSLDPTERHTWWSLLVGGIFTFLWTYGFHQAQVQKYLTLHNYETARKTIYVGGIISATFTFSLAFTGLCLYSRYYKCDPFKSGAIESQDQLVPYFVVDVLDRGWPGVAGLIIAGVFSASISTISTTLNSLANVSAQDFIKPLYLRCGRNLSDRQLLFLSKLLACSFGILLMVIAYIARFIAGLQQVAITLLGLVGGPTAAVFMLGMFVPLANEPGAVASLLSGVALSLWLNFGGKRSPIVNLPSSLTGCPNTTASLTTILTADSLLTKPRLEEYFYLHRISYLWNVVLSSLFAFFVGIIVSVATNKVKSERKDSDLFSPPVAAHLKKKDQRHKNKQVVEYSGSNNVFFIGKFTKRDDSLPNA